MKPPYLRVLLKVKKGFSPTFYIYNYLLIHSNSNIGCSFVETLTNYTKFKAKMEGISCEKMIIN